MSVGDESVGNELEPNEAGNGGVETGAEDPGKRRIDFGLEISDVGPCKKHLKISIPREEIERQFEESLVTLRKEAQVPGFRPGRAPRTLVQKRFRKEMSGQVKSTLLMACMEQIDEEHKLNPITQPNIDLDAINLPDDGPLDFAFDVEVQPEFTLPDYKSMTVKRPLRKIRDRDVEDQIRVLRERGAQVVPKLEGSAEVGDFVVADMNFSLGGIALNQVKEMQFRLQPQLRFRDGMVPDLDKVLVGAKPGDVRDAKAKTGSGSPDPALRNQEIDVTFVLHDLKTLRLPEVDQEFLSDYGFDSLGELKDAMHGVLERRAEFQARQAVRQQIVSNLIEQVPFDLPSELVKRQERTTTRRLVSEMREAGYSDNQLRAREAEIRANAHEVTLRTLKEFFLLSKVAEAEQLKVEESDLDEEIETIAARSDESPRRVRARLQKEGQVDNLMTQILERKAIERILEFITVEIEEVTAPAPDEGEAVETVDQAAGTVEETSEDAEDGSDA